MPSDVLRSMVLSSLDVLHSVIDVGVALRIPHSFDLSVWVNLIFVMGLCVGLREIQMVHVDVEECNAFKNDVIWYVMVVGLLCFGFRLHHSIQATSCLENEENMLLTYVGNVSLEECLFEESTVQICSNVFEYQQVQAFISNGDDMEILLVTDGSTVTQHMSTTTMRNEENTVTNEICCDGDIPSAGVDLNERHTYEYNVENTQCGEHLLYEEANHTRTLSGNISHFHEHASLEESEVECMTSAAIEESIKAARHSQTNAKSSMKVVQQIDVQPNIVASSSCIILAIKTWLQEIKTRKDNDDRNVLNGSQHKVVAMVCERICKEIQVLQWKDLSSLDEPLRWSMHGGPGTGKTHVIKIIKKELFENILGWNMQDEFLVVAMQTQAANLCDGDTIHQAFSLPCSSEGNGVKKSGNIDQFSKLRWLIIDDFNMVCATLFASIDVKLRSMCTSVNKYAFDRNGRIKPFAGVNVLCSGDLWQLSPPQGGMLGSMPIEYIAGGQRHIPRVCEAHGQSLIWSGADTGIQGVR